MQRRNFLITAGAMLASRAMAHPNETPGGTLRLPLRSRVEVFKGSGVWQEVRIEQTLFVNNHSRTNTAKALGISRVTLYNKMKRYAIAG